MSVSFEWTKIEAAGTLPPARYGHSFSVVGDCAYVFGGAHGGVGDQPDPQFFNDMYSINLSSTPLAWKKVAQKGAIPSPREGHSCSVVGKSIFLFAGTGEGDACFQDLHVFDVATETWAPAKFTGTPPSNRNNHAAAVVGSRIFIFGGFLDGIAGNDVHIFDTKTSAWTNVKAQGKPPVVRCDHTWVPAGNKLVVFGGAGDDVWYNDLHIFHTETLTWSTPATKGTAPGERDYHVALLWDEKTMLIFGGANDSAGGKHYNDVHLFDSASATWVAPKVTGTPPSVRWGHAAVFYNGKMFAFGGNSDAKFYNDLWQLAIVRQSELPVIPPRSTSNAAPIPVAKKDSNLEAPVPIPQKRTAYTTPTAIPSPRVVVLPTTPGKVAPRDLSAQKNKMLAVIDGIFADLEKEYLELDQERAAFNAEKAAFQEEKKANRELFEKQQKELVAMMEQHKEENNELTRKRQVQYEEMLEEIRLKQEALKANEDKFKQTLQEFDANKKKMEAVMAQFAAFKTS